MHKNNITVKISTKKQSKYVKELGIYEMLLGVFEFEYFGTVKS